MNIIRLLLIVLVLFSSALLAAKQTWKPLVDDGLHDPQSPAIELLQEPAEALILLPPDTTGNMVAWVEALRDKYIEPRTNLYSTTIVKILDMDIILEKTGEMPLVRFPHLTHTEWLDCDNCHDSIFKEKVGANPINMFAILNGEYCGRCHGAVSFPLTECLRCHSVARKTFKGKPGVQPLESASGSTE
jgi:c(7)-type cytochrome triheme protein